LPNPADCNLQAMNWHYLLRRALGRATCVLAPRSRLGAPARIINIGGDSSLIRIGESTIIEGELLVFPHGGRIAIGAWSYVGAGTRIWSDTDIQIGNRVMISHNVNIFDNLTHPLDATARHAQFRQIAGAGHPRKMDLGGRAVVVADDAWIAASATLLRGVTIGRGAIVGAGAVVTRDVPSGAIVAGNPARLIRELSLAESTCQSAVDTSVSAQSGA